MSDPRTVTYLATRDHPDAGTLLKVGVSNDPKRRCKQLGATLHKPFLPARCEAEIHAFLSAKRVWSEHFSPYVFQPDPVFPAHTEWFYTYDLVLGDWIRAYVNFVQATAALLK